MTFWKRPSFWTALIAIVAYWDARALNGGYVYDDAGSVIKNVVVNGAVDWKEAFTRDFWGQEMKEARSHKSFRPITTLTLKLNFLYEDKYKDKDATHPPTYSFHLVNVILHGIVTGLITEATWYILPDIISQLIVGFLFGLHPAHAEVVSNITSRGELLMSLFFAIAFLSYASSLHQEKGRSTLNSSSNSSSGLRKVVGLYLVPWLCMTLSLFSKEQGATTLISLVLYDFLLHHGNVLALWRKLMAKDGQAWGFVLRTLILAVQTIVVVLWRYILNGETSPDFIDAQNPAGFAKDRFTRSFSVSWVYCLYIRDAIYPYYLSPDWSGLSIDLITSLSDYRAMLVVCLWYFSANSFWTLLVGRGLDQGLESGNGGVDGGATEKKIDDNNNNTLLDDLTLRKINMAVWAFTFSPFLLSSNILVVVGLMKADRVIYLPLFGFCLLEALLLSKLLKGTVSMMPSFESRREQKFWCAHFFLMFQLIVFSGRTHERNVAWSDSLRLWGSAYAVNSKSHHTMYNYGYELSIKGRFAEAESVLRPIGDPRVEGPSNTFVYAMVLFNLKRCDEANRFLDEAFEVVEEKRRAGGVRNSESSLSRTESNLLVAQAHCVTDNMPERARIMYKAVEIDPSNDYAVGLATQMMEKLQKYEELKASYTGA
jgi:hypothetical protein